MTDHPMQPPQELVQKWTHEATGPNYEEIIATRAAQWGADQELEACCEYMGRWVPHIDGIDASKSLYAARRPKPPSLKQQALVQVDALAKRRDLQADLSLLRSALEALPDDI